MLSTSLGFFAGLEFLPSSENPFSSLDFYENIFKWSSNTSKDLCNHIMSGFASIFKWYCPLVEPFHFIIWVSNKTNYNGLVPMCWLKYLANVLVVNTVYICDARMPFEIKLKSATSAPSKPSLLLLVVKKSRQLLTIKINVLSLTR